MRILTVALPALVSALLPVLAGCPGPAALCGQSTVPPTTSDVVDGRGTATRSDGAGFDEAGSWSTANISITIGTLDIIATNDETGSDVADLIEAAAFPICVPTGERSETSGSVNLVDGAFISDGSHTGGVAILGKEGDILLGRFGFELVNGGGDTLTFSDGVFRVPTR